MKFQKGYIPWNKNRKCPEISNALEGKKHSKEHKRNQSKGIKNNLPSTSFKKGYIPWNYIDGRSKTISPARYGSGWKKIRTRILIRDDYECQKCGIHKSKVRFMDVHHKIPFLTSFDNSEGNLIALCRGCHALAEKEVD